jgi:hypothetical protein
LNLILAVVAFFLSFGFLYASRIFLTSNQAYAGGDAFFHLLISKSIKRNRWKYPSSLEKVIFDEGEKKYNYLAYPPLLHYIIAVFPFKSFLSLSKILNLFLLSILGSLAALVAYNFSQNFMISILAVFVALFSMAVFELETMFTPRPLGLLFYSLLLYSIIFFSPSVILFLVATFLVSLIVLTHKFATQILLFTILPYAILFNEPYLILCLAFGFLLAVLLTKGSSLKVFKEHISWLYFYSRHPPHYSYSYKLKRTLARNPWYLLFFVAFLSVLFLNSSLLDSLMIKMIFWALLPLIVALIVTIPKLTFLGEDYRYIEYSIVPVAVIGTISMASLNLYVLLVFFVCLSISAVVMLKYKKHIFRSKWLVDPKDLVAYQSLKDSGVSDLLVFPPNRTLEVNFFTELSVIDPIRKKESFTLTELFEDLLNKYSCKYVIHFKDVDPYDRFSVFKNMVNVERVLSFENFDVYAVGLKKQVGSP